MDGVRGSQSLLYVGPLLAWVKGLRGELSPCVDGKECDVSGGRAVGIYMRAGA